ncbi:hypothetical protein TcWFU_004762 [Taenia crassiceps]|uniref:Uncharacterized protein n=1 Tax=Taenia crassiceps TaxID=6207 RepID=A0ABR4QDJ9_9CEST
MYVLEKYINVGLDTNGVLDGMVNEFLCNISLLQSKSPSIDKSDVDVLHKLSLYQRSRWTELQKLKNSFSLRYAEWLFMRPLYLDMAVLSGDSSVVRAKDLNGSTNMESNANELSSLSRLMERTGDLFRTMGNSLTRFADGPSLGTEPSSELSWCSRSLSRIAESCKFFEQKTLANDAKALLSRLDDILATLDNLIAEESDILSVSINRSSGRLSGLYMDTSMDSNNRPSSQGVPLNSLSLLSKSQVSYSTPTKGTELVGGISDEIGEVTEKPTRHFPNVTADVANFRTNDDLFNDINTQLASLLQATTSNIHGKSIENESTGDVQSNSQVGTPHIQPPLVPLRLSSRRASLKSLRLGIPISSEEAISRNEIVLSNAQSSSHLKSFSEFSMEDDSDSRSPRPPLVSIDVNVEGRKRPIAPLSLDSLYLNSPSDERENHQGDGTERENDSCPEDESLGLLSFGNMSDCASQIFLSP